MPLDGAADHGVSEALYLRDPRRAEDSPAGTHVSFTDRQGRFIDREVAGWQSAPIIGRQMSIRIFLGLAGGALAVSLGPAIHFAMAETPKVTQMNEQAQQDQRLDYVEFQATDLERTKNFYSAAFGWQFIDYGPTYTSFHDGRLSGGFEKKAAAAPGAEPDVASGGPLVVIYAVNLEATYARVIAHGGSIARYTFDFPGGRRFHFTDPSGNELAVWSEPQAEESEQ